MTLKQQKDVLREATKAAEDLVVTPNVEPAVYLVFRDDLKMSAGKIAAQAGHAIQLLLRKIDTDTSPRASTHQLALSNWEEGSYAKITLAAPDLMAFEDAVAAAEAEGIPVAVVVDEGRTEIAAGSITCAAIGPIPKRSLGALQKLKLLR